MGGTAQPVVLVVEDEPAVAESFEMMLAGEYDVRTALNGESALEQLDDEVDVVLLDRMMPGMSGDEVLATIRERGVDCQVAMVTAVDPDFDIIEMGFDDYVTKPPTRAQLQQTVEDLLERRVYDDTVEEYNALLSKRAALQTEKTEAELADSEEFADLQRRIESLEAELDEDRDRLLDDTEFVGTLQDLTEEPHSEGER